MFLATPPNIDYTDFQRQLTILPNYQIEANIAPGSISGNLDSEMLFLREIKSLDEGVKLKKTINLTIEFSQDGFSGYYKPLSLYAFSDTVSEIEKEIKDEILDLWDWLKETDESGLGKEPLEWKSHLNEIILA